eukprot:NODE_32160_length_382_cov_1.278431.p2 GENE.NODE_32160_length_382_cov_1.278431~~NODE_32160_length_382_cov_1.278431.p2  ORF type:complete len:107 (-),score=12.94 NODE_32160_length_382_cov_1.278431:62-352(-)
MRDAFAWYAELMNDYYFPEDLKELLGDNEDFPSSCRPESGVSKGESEGNQKCSLTLPPRPCSPERCATAACRANGSPCGSRSPPRKSVRMRPTFAT